MNMQKLEYQVRFVTPAFLGNAEQKGQWRTPPFKALLRQWWRIVRAPALQVGYDHVALKKEEAALFGLAADTAGSGSGRSRVVVRLDSWKHGTMDQWKTCGRVHHPEVGNGGREVGADLYLGYGPLNYERDRGTMLANIRETGVQRTAIDPSENARLALLVQESDLAELQRTMQLIAHFGTLGSRSRNGWGSLDIQPDNEHTPAFAPLTRSNLERWNVCRPLADCLRLDWPHAIGTDEKGPLVWRLNPQSDWKAAIKELAALKIKFRTQFPFQGNAVEKRHVLAYPVTNHQVWGSQKRMANQLRFKLSRRQDNKVEALIYHLPCKVPEALTTNRQEMSVIRGIERKVWQAVHATLDNDKNARRLE